MARGVRPERVAGVVVEAVELAVGFAGDDHAGAVDGRRAVELGVAAGDLVLPADRARILVEGPDDAGVR